MSEFKNQPAGQFESELTPANKIICQELDSVSKSTVIGLLLHGSLKLEILFCKRPGLYVKDPRFCPLISNFVF